MSPVAPEPDRARTNTTSTLLRQVVSELSGQHDVAVDHIVRQLRHRSFGGLFILLASAGLLPGLSVFAGLAMLVPAAQLAIGFRAPVLPGFIRRRQINVATVTTYSNKVIPWIERIEQFAKPRWLVLTLPPVLNFIGITVIGLAFVIMLPLPFSNLPPAVAMLCLSIGLLERDGLMISIGLLATLAALVLGVVMAVVAIEAVTPVLRGYIG